MNVKQMKFIDYYAGMPLCFALSIHKKFRRRESIFPPSAPLKVLVMKFFGMGSIILASPLLKALKKKYPNAEITFLTFEGNREVCELLGLTDKVIALRTEKLSCFVSDLFKFIFSLRKSRYDIVIDMEFFSKFSESLAYITGAVIRIGFVLPSLWRGNLLTHPVYYNHSQHVTATFLNLAEPLGVNSDSYYLPSLVCSDIEKKKIETLLDRGDSKLVIFNVNSGDLCIERRWTRESFITLAQKLREASNCKIVFIGSFKDKKYVNSIVSHLDPLKVYNLSGKLNLRELLALFEIGNLFITNDGGPLHLAELTSIPTVSFFGPETPSLYGPKGDRHIVFYKGLACSPCLNMLNLKTAPCRGDNQCLRLITPEEVFKVVRNKIFI